MRVSDSVKIVLILLGLAALARWPILLTPSLDWDEANTLAQAQLPLLEMISLNIRRDISLPGMPLLLHFWVSLFGGTDGAIRLFAYLMGLLGVGATYALAVQISKSRLVGFLTACLCIGAPFLMHYSRLVTKHSVYFTLVIASWALLLNLVERQASARLGVWQVALYLGVTILAVHFQPIGPVFLLFQGIYLWSIRHQVKCQRLWAMVLIAGVTFLPELWALLQPWHPVHLPEIKAGYTVADPLTLLWTFPNLLLVGHDRWQPDMPFWQYWGVGLFSAVALLQGWKALYYQADRQPFRQVLTIGFWPLLAMGLLAWWFQMGFYQYRAILLGTFFAAFLVACWAIDLKKRQKKYWLAPVLAVILVQSINWWYQMPGYSQAHYKMWGETIQQYFQPGDGLVVMPGFHYLPLMRYFRPTEFGLTPEELGLNPRTENIYNMVNHQAADYFFVSGQAVALSPSVLGQFVEFQKRHKRLWIVSETTYTPYYDCSKTYLMLKPEGGATIYKCQKRRFCHQDLPVSPQGWQCD